MRRKRFKININPFVVLITIFLVACFFLLRAESNLIHKFIYSTQEHVEEKQKKQVTKNGFYLFRENTSNSLTFFGGCTVNYFDNYLVVVNDEYHVYRSSCIGTFYRKNGKTKDLKFEDDDNNKVYVTLDNNKFYKTESINYVKTENKFADMNGISPNYYKILFSEITATIPNVILSDISFNVFGAGLSFNFRYNEIENNYSFQIYNGETSNLYSKNVTKIENLPELRAFSKSLVLIDELEDTSAYHYSFKVLSNNGLIYNIEDKFPIKVNNVQLTKNNSIVIKYNSKDNNFVMLVGNDKKMCYEDSDSNDIAYYVFNINYNYLNKVFDKPEIIKIVYKKDGCNYYNEVMEW